MRKIKRKQIPKLNTKLQIKMWNEIYIHGCKELLFQKQRRTAFCIQKIINENSFGKKRVLIENFEELEFIFFSEDFARQIGGKVFEKLYLIFES